MTVEGMAATGGGSRVEGSGSHALPKPCTHYKPRFVRPTAQCGFCTPGMLMTLLPFLRENPSPTPEEIREAISGNLCRCTGYQNIVEAVQLAAERSGSPTTSMEAMRP